MAEKLTREELVKALAALDERDRKNDADMAPFRKISQQIEEERQALVDAHETEVIGSCEGCLAVILEGDRYTPCSDGPLLCLACSPTWSEALNNMRSYVCDVPEDDAERLESIAHAEAQIAAGRGDEKVC